MSPKTPKIWKKYQSGHFEQEAIQETFDAFVFHLNNSPTAQKLQNIFFLMAVQSFTRALNFVIQGHFP